MSRWISGVVMVLAVVLSLVFLPNVPLFILVVFLGAALLAEIFQMAKRPKLEIAFGLVFYFISMGLQYLVMSSGAFFAKLTLFHSDLTLVFFIIFFVSFLLQMSGSKNYNEKVSGFLFFFGILFYLIISFSSILLLTKDDMRIALAGILVLNYGADTGAYIAGKKFGKRKIAPSLSPKKTWEGLYGGIILSMVLAVIFVFAVIKIMQVPNYSGILWLCLLACLGAAYLTMIGFFGDLFQSMIKRHFGVKDSGNIIPGHGGLWDRLDSLLFSAPMFFAGTYVVGMIVKLIK